MRFPSTNTTPVEPTREPGFWRSRYAIGVVVMGAVASYFLLTEHLVHTLGALPYLLLAACPLMHLFMHHGHDGHKHPPGDGAAPTPPAKPGEPP
ncbi:DUF2933 domain-containing protein [Rhodoferax sp.]|uniref:DUF2933 domain-containing protein n=1 Tax=Rhodoferax sp. TaxID=50421 RepID=UPI0025E89B60|nr:DUF2933 domain-containing protein [Rhodoferax sp.]MCM2295639.1 DUF2933 domain-containing protein [Rhodoferax sp.]